MRLITYASLVLAAGTEDVITLTPDGAARVGAVTFGLADEYLVGEIKMGSDSQYFGEQSGYVKATDLGNCDLAAIQSEASRWDLVKQLGDRFESCVTPCDAANPFSLRLKDIAGGCTARITVHWIPIVSTRY